MRGAWIEISAHRGTSRTRSRRSPCGERGLKCPLVAFCARSLSSLPVRGAWIEMVYPCHLRLPPRRRSPCGERGLKFPDSCFRKKSRQRRSPCGERGLKFVVRVQRHNRQWSLPVRGAWIEIFSPGMRVPPYCGRSPCGERGLKFSDTPEKTALNAGRSPCGERGLKSSFRRVARLDLGSLPVRGAWIEMREKQLKNIARAVAPRAGSVD